MPTPNWLQRAAAFRAAEAVPCRLLQPINTHGDGDARTWLVHGNNLQALKRSRPHHGPRLVYHEACALGSAQLQAEDNEFRQIPYEFAAS